MSDELPIDRLTHLLARAEEFFVRLDYGVSSSLTLERGVLLTFCKHSGKWGLYIARRGYPGTMPNVEPLQASSKRCRVLAASRLGELHAALLAARDEQDRAVVEACVEVCSFLRAMKGEGG